jgi:transcriptional regulator with XRE-family HTH domain
MVCQPNRIRQARRLAKLSQQSLAQLVGVHRSAVAQWEKADGCHPTVANLSRIALATSVQFEWLATGRGRMCFQSDIGAVPGETPALIFTHSAHTEIEARVLCALRKLSSTDVIAFAELLECMAGNRAPKPKRGIAYSR